MTRAVFVKKSQKDIWSQGKKVTKTHEAGKHKGETYETYDTSVKGSKDDVLVIAKGESYWHWAFRFGPRHVSKEQPKRSQLTQSEWLGRAYSLEEDMVVAEASTPGDLSSLKDEWCSEIECMKEEAEERLENMPEGLRENSSSGQTLQEYIDAFEQWHDELDGIDVDIDEDEIRSDAHDRSLNEGSEETEDEIFSELLLEKVEELLGEMQATSSGL
jgi:Rad3-related DNA helicase